MKELKIIFGVLLILAGLSGLIVSFFMLSNGVSKAGGTTVGEKLFFSIGFLGLGIYLFTNANSKKTKGPQHNNQKQIN